MATGRTTRGSRSLTAAVLSGATVILALAGCGSTAALAPADSQTPAAGACAVAAGTTVAVTLAVDVPTPRCTQVVPSQSLLVVNRTSVRVTVRLGGEHVAVAPGETAAISRPFGAYLRSGVHRLRVDSYPPGGPELWLREASALTSVAPTSTTAVAASCSAATLSPELPADPGLPAAVATMRADLARAAVACDYDALARLADRNGKGVRFTFGPGSDPIPFWRAAEAGEGDVRPLRALRLLLALPHTEQQPGNGSVVYVWPRAFAAEHPTDAQLQEVAATGLYSMATLTGWVASGNNYLGYRILITAGGDWTAFVEGD